MKKIILILMAISFMGCKGELHDKIVKDKDGNYYMLNGKDALGIDRYKLTKVDTTIIRTF